MQPPSRTPDLYSADGKIIKRGGLYHVLLPDGVVDTIRVAAFARMSGHYTRPCNRDHLVLSHDDRLFGTYEVYESRLDALRAASLVLDASARHFRESAKPTEERLAKVQEEIASLEPRPEPNLVVMKEEGS